SMSEVAMSGGAPLARYDFLQLLDIFRPFDNLPRPLAPYRRPSYNRTGFPQHERALGAGRRGPGEQGERGDHRSPSQSHHRWPSSALSSSSATLQVVPAQRLHEQLADSLAVVAGLRPVEGVLPAGDPRMPDGVHDENDVGRSE